MRIDFFFVEIHSFFPMLVNKSYGFHSHKNLFCLRMIDITQVSGGEWGGNCSLHLGD